MTRSPRRSFHALIDDYIVADGDIVEPRAGQVVTGLGFRLLPHVSTPTGEVGRRETVAGIVRWVEENERSATRDALVDAGEFRIIVQTDRRTDAVVIGSTVEMDGVLLSIGPYEFEQCGTPDVRQSWTVLSSHEDAGRWFYAVEVEVASGA